jgi:hypothetical protein
MQGIIEVYRWRDFDSFVRKSLKLGSTNSHKVLDTVAEDLIRGHLRVRDRGGHPLTLSPSATQLSLCYLCPAEVDRLPVMINWGLCWGAFLKEKASSKKPMSVKRQLKSLGWKATLQAEATRIWREIKKSGGKPSLRSIAEQLHKFAVTNDIRADRGVIPSAAYIGTHVISRKHWTTPK